MAAQRPPRREGRHQLRLDKARRPSRKWRRLAPARRETMTAAVDTGNARCGHVRLTSMWATQAGSTRPCSSAWLCELRRGCGQEDRKTAWPHDGRRPVSVAAGSLTLCAGRAAGGRWQRFTRRGRRSTSSANRAFCFGLAGLLAGSVMRESPAGSRMARAAWQARRGAGGCRNEDGTPQRQGYRAPIDARDHLCARAAAAA